MGFLGIRTKNITHYHSQSFAPINGGWLPDPIATAAMSGVTRGGDIVETVQNEMKFGSGAKLRQYYQYATRRFKKRNIKSYIITRSSVPVKIDYIDDATLDGLLPNLKDKFATVVQEWDTLNLSGPKFYWDMKELYGLDGFTPPDAQGNNIFITNLRKASEVLQYTGSLGNSWVIGIETSKDIPAIILDPSIPESRITEPVYIVARDDYTPIPSMGATYWTAPEENYVEEQKGTEEPLVLKHNSQYFKDWGFKVVKNEVEREQVIYNSYSLEGDIPPRPLSDEMELSEDFQSSVNVISEEEVNSDIEAESEAVNTTVKVTRRMAKFSPQTAPEVTAEVFNDRFNPYYAEFHGVEYDSSGTVEMNAEGFIWVTEQGGTNVPGAEKIFKADNKAMEQIFSQELDTSGIFKWYPYMPTKENEHNYANLSKMGKYVNALRAQNNLDEGDAQEIDAPKIDRIMVQEQNKAPRKSTLSAETENVLKRESAYLRKIELNPGWGIEYQDLRHFKEMGKLLGVDWAEFAAQDESSDSDSYMNVTIPSVPLGSNADEVNEYWWEFWNRVHNKMGSVINARFESAVKNLPDDANALDLGNLPITRLHWIGFKVDGFMAFTSIHKFRISGWSRRTKRKRKLKEILPGKLVPVGQLRGEDLKYALLNPPRELVHMNYHTSNAGKDYNIGKRFNEGFITYDLTTLRDPRYHTMQLYSNTPDVEEIGKKYRSGLARALYRNSLRNPHTPSGHGDGEDEVIRLLERDSFGRGHAHVIYSSQSELAFFATDKFGYTFICKPIGRGFDLEVIAIGGLVGGIRSPLGLSPGQVDLTGHYIAARACYELALFHHENNVLYVQKKSREKANLFTSFTEGPKKNRLVVNVSRFFIVPLEYKTFSRMSSIHAVRLAPRAVMQNTWQKQRVKRYRGWVKTVITIIGIIVTIVVTIYSWGSGTYQTATTFASFIAALAKAVAIQLIVRWGIKALVRAFGLKGIILLIVAIIAMAVARNTSYFGQMFSSLPMASQTATSQIATSATQNVMTQASQSVMQQLSTALQTTFQQSISEFVNASGKQILIDMFNQIATVANSGLEYFQDQQADIQKQLEEETTKYNDAIGELLEAREELEENYAPYDVTKVLSQFRAVSPLDMDMFLNFYTMADNTIASLDYLSGYLDQKSNIEAEFFNIDDSIDFSLGMKKWQ